MSVNISKLFDRFVALTIVNILSKTCYLLNGFWHVLSLNNTILYLMFYLQNSWIHPALNGQEDISWLNSEKNTLQLEMKKIHWNDISQSDCIQIHVSVDSIERGIKAKEDIMIELQLLSY